MNDEVWKPWPVNPHYLVSTKGRVQGAYRGGRRHLLKPQKTSIGYLSYKLKYDGKSRTVMAHRVVAQTFIPNENPELLTDTDHINGIRDDNRVENLRWVSHAENVRCRHPEIDDYAKQRISRNLSPLYAVSGIGRKMYFKNMNAAVTYLVQTRKTVEPLACPSNIHTSIARGIEAYGFRWKYADPLAYGKEY